MGSVGGDCKPTAMVADKNNNIYVAGYFNGTVDFDPSAGVKNLSSNGDYDIYVAKYTQSGVLVWAESMGGANLDQVNYMCVDANGSITITGQSSSSSFDADPGPGATTLVNKGAEDIFFIHLDTDGKFLWANLIGSFSTDRGEEINADSQGNVVLTAIFSGPITLGANNYTPFSGFNGLVAKYNQTGNLLWSISLGGNGTEVYGNAVDSHDNIIVSGIFNGTVNFNPLGTAYNVSASASNMPFIAKYSPAGQLLWFYKYTGILTYNNSFINVDSNDNIRLSAGFSGLLSFPGQPAINGIGASNIFIAKFLTDGTLLWVKAMNGQAGSYSYPYQMQTDQDGNAYLTGYLMGTVDFNPDPSAVANINYHGQRDFFLAKFDVDGNYKWAFSAGNPSCDQTLGLELAINSNRDLFLGGSFCKTVDFDPSDCNILSLTAKNSTSDTFIAAYSQYIPSADLSQISGFNVPGQVSSVIDLPRTTITVTMPNGADITQLSPSITTDKGGTLTPLSGVAKDFTKPVNYVLTTSCASLTYTVNVVFETAVAVTSICPDEGSTLTGASLTIPPDSYLWQIKQGSTWVSAAGINTGAKYIITAGQFQNTTGAPVIYSFRRHVTTGVTNTDDSFYNVTVNPNTQNNTIASDVAQACAGPQVINFTGNQPTGYTSNISYFWQRSTDNTTWTTINAAVQQNYQFSGSLTQATYFRRGSTLGTCSSFSNAILIGYQSAVSTANAGLSQQLCQQTQTTLNANAPAVGETGTWSVVSPAGYNPFTAANVNDPKAVINNLPIGVTVVLKWSILKTSCGQISESNVTVTNNDKNQVSGFLLNEQTAPAKIDQVNHTIAVKVFYGTNITALSPQITTVSPGTITPSSGTPQNFSTPVTYTIGSACGPVSYTVNVSVNAPPVQLFQCPGTLTGLSGETTSVTVDSYQWQINNNGSWVTANGSNNTADYQAANLVNTTATVLTYHFRRRVNSAGNIIYDSFYDVSLNPGVINTLSVNTSNVCASAPQNVVINGNVPTGIAANSLAYRWESSTDMQNWLGINSAITANYATSLTQTQYFRRIVSANGCDYFSNAVKITYYNQVSVANAGTDQSVCNQSTVTLAANNVAGNETGTWSVVSPASYQPFTPNNIHNPNAVIGNLPVDVDVKLIWTINQVVCGESSASTVNIRNNSIPVVDAGTDVTINAGEKTTLNGNVTGGYVSVKWSPADGLSDTQILNPVASPVISTQYQLTVTNAAGCTFSANVNVEVRNEITFPNAFTPNGDGINDTWDIKNISAYSDAEVHIFTRWGKPVFYSKGYKVPWGGFYEGKKVSAGVYYYLIVINGGLTKLSGTLTVVY